MKRTFSIHILLVLLLAALLMGLCACGSPDQGPETEPETSAGTEPSGTESVPAETETQDSGPGTQKDPNTLPRVIETRFETPDTVVAVADVLDFGADPTGEKDSTQAIKLALTAASVLGGGTVWMPAGVYRVTKSISIPTLVTLRGDYGDPDLGQDYGTVILADVKSENRTGTGLFSLNVCSGIRGITFLYPNQAIEDVKPYPFTIYLSKGKVHTVQDVTFLNSYRGIYIDEGETPKLFNVKGTCLMTGVENMSTADVGSFDGVTFTPDYWAACTLKQAGTASRDAIRNWSLSNGSCGLLIHDVEIQEFKDIVLKGFAYGIFFSAEPTRYMSSGVWYNVGISECTCGIYAQEGTFKSSYGGVAPKSAIDWASGHIFSKCSVSGTEYSIRNLSSEITINGVKQGGYIKLASSTLDGPTEGKVLYSNLGEALDLSAFEIDTDRITRSTGTAFRYVEPETGEAGIQAALDEVGQAGGGVVYVCAGTYEISNGLVVPANTSLLGAAGSAQRTAGHGTVFKCASPASDEPVTGGALVSLEGRNAGISGIYFLYADNISSLDRDGTYRFYKTALYGNASGVWATNLCISGANYGIRFEDCDDYFIESLFSGCIQSVAELSGDRGLVTNCLNNGGTVIFINDAVSTTVTRMHANYFQKEAGRNTRYLTIGKGTGQTVVNCFSYGSRSLIDFEDAADTVVVNTGSDALTDHQFSFTNSSLFILNTSLTSGERFTATGSAYSIYNAEHVNNASQDADVVFGT